jgi:Ran-binding protein 3
MRKEAVYTVLLNVTLFAGMRCFLSSDPRYLRFSIIEGGKTIHYNLRVSVDSFLLARPLTNFVVLSQVSNAKIAEELLEEINDNIPTP